MRVLHVVHSMPRHGTETWLMHVLRNIDRRTMQMDFLVHTLESHAYDDEIRALGSQVIPCLHPSTPGIYARNFRRVLTQHGPYDIVHSHIHHYSGFILRLAHQAGIRVRIAHSHSDTSLTQRYAPLHRRAYFMLMRHWISHYATLGLAVSQQAASALFGPQWQTDSRWQVLSSGIDLTPFKTPVDSISLRAKLGLPPDAWIIGHVGRFYEPKNHSFLIDIFAEIRKLNSQAFLLLIGDGPLRPIIEQKVTYLGLTDHVLFTGAMDNIPQIMLGAMDNFLFPSLYEGLGLVLIEAQAAGLPCTYSDAIPREVDVIKPLIQRLSLSKTSADWAMAVLYGFENTRKKNTSNFYKMLQQTDFNIFNGINELTDLYSSLVA
jgi:glycosyltransferase involved in cell wall biosynthesis